MKIAVVTPTMEYGLQCITARVQNMIDTDIRGGSKFSQISCILDITCNNNFDGEFGQLWTTLLVKFSSFKLCS